MAWTEISFGKHAGKSLPQILFTDPDWFFWAVETGVFSKRPALAIEAAQLDSRARHIKPPSKNLTNPIVEYLIHRPTMKFSHFNIVEREQELHIGGSPAFRSNVIDMSVPRRIAQYDKTGCKSLISSLKLHIFGSKSARITRERAEAFFSDVSNFL
ncbi:hypothetical protein [Variovorax sp. N23]|uniref:hypothetical protein n=1 Tax=Variovorax sp. N23 TaxID=2980555 RepID=UPI0021C7AD1F|nr:hypothetical protein [Variovorax sp. N23]MCU4119809.1 hypothetical protein [Variovorax sp. N23]